MTYTPPDVSTPAGWYADPANAAVHRWWDGAQWTVHAQPAPTYGSPVGGMAVGYPPAGPAPRPFPAQPETGGRKKHGLYNAEVDLANGKNSPATNALVLGIICLFVNFLLLASIAAIVWGGIGLSRANMYENRGYPPVGRKKAGWGMGLGIVGLLASVALKGLMF